MKKILLLFSLLFVACFAFAQVTTGNLTGVIKDAKGLPLPGATVVATHVPSGSVYSTVSTASGQYTLPNLRVGGPYKVAITFIGYNPKTSDGITISLGETSKLDFTLDDNTKLLNEVVVTSTSGATAEKMGTSTNVTQRQITDLPTVSRSFQDFARLTPQAVPIRGSSDNSPLGISFAGQSSKYNQFTVDGAKANDVFGLSTSGTNGGLASVNPIPLESIESFQILISPYDVTQGRFVGGGVNAVTKSGTNDFHGSAYDYIQNQGFIGKSVTTGLKYANFTNKTYGASLGGPIIKNKLFFFANIERTEDTNPIAYDPTQAGSGSKFDPAVLEQIRQQVLKLSNNTYDPGSYGGINKTITSTSFFARLDWNINDKNKLTLRNSYVDGNNLALSRSPTSITFSNSGYTIQNRTNSTVLELNSSISDHSSNVFRATYNYINDVRNTSAFPSIYITEGSLSYNIGGDYSSAANSLAQKDFNIVDYFTIYKGKHTITFGTDDEFYTSRNIFLQNYNGDYTYYSVASFLSGGLPGSYAVGYSTKGGADKAPAVMHVGQMSVYGQDIFAVSDKFKLNYGLRIDIPVFFNSPSDNAGFNSSSFASTYGVATNKTPKSTPLFSPRVGFTYDVNGDGMTKIRGGAGIFTGQVPFVWISNQYTNTGVAAIKYSTNTPSQGAGSFNYSPGAPHSGAYIPSGFTAAPTEIDVTDPNFKFPQQLRANLAVDQKLPWGLTGTLEALYSKKLHDILYQNLNVGPQTTDITLGSTTRPYYNFTRANSAYADVVELTNTNKGYSYDFTAQLKKQFTNGWSAMAAYTYGQSYSVNDGTSSTAISNWRYAYTTNGQNSLDESHSNYDPGSRLIAYVSKTFSYVNKRISTTIGVVYSGQTGQRYSYLYNYNLNGDDVTSKKNAQDLVYIPTDASQFAALGSVSGAQQYANLQAFLADNKDLAKYVGKNTPRNAFTMPWENHFDVKIAQNFYVYKQHKLTIGLDILNAGNLIDKKWGRAYYMSNQSYNLFGVASQTANPTFTFDNTKLNTVDGHLRAYSIDDYNSRWRGQLDLRYSF